LFVLFRITASDCTFGILKNKKNKCFWQTDIWKSTNTNAIGLLCAKINSNEHKYLNILQSQSSFTNDIQNDKG
jgi:hypothetical protein